MDNVNSEKRVKKKPFKLKTDSSDGVLLKIHQTCESGDGVLKRICFKKMCLNDSNDVIVAVDHRDNIFTFDLISLKFWSLSGLLTKCEVCTFTPQSRSQVLFGTRSGDLFLIDIESGKIVHQTKAHNYPIIDIGCTSINSTDDAENPSTPSSNNILLLTVTKLETKLFDLISLKLRHTLEYSENSLTAIYVAFIPNDNKIFTCFSDDTIHIWNQHTMEPITQFAPLKKLHNAIKTNLHATVNIYENSDGNGSNDIRWPLLSAHFPKGRIRSVCFGNDGKVVCLGTVDNFLVILSTLDNWEIRKIIQLIDVQIREISYLSHLGVEHDQMHILVLSLNGDTILMNVDNANMKTIIHQENGHKLGVNGRNAVVFGILLSTGEILIEKSDFFLGILESYQRNLEYHKEMPKDNTVLLERVFSEIKSTLSKTRLIQILNEFGEFPSRYRTLIWRTLLELPQNGNILIEIVKKGEHNAVANFNRTHPLKDITALRNLKKIISALAHWSTVFGEVTYLPDFVFPFLKLYHCDLLSTFETVATILLNQCQLWFEFYPLEPLNYLGMVENILSHFEPTLINFYMKKRIPSKVYAMILMTNGFSEVFTEAQWFQLWDNVVANEPYFLLFAIVAYNIALKPIIMKLEFNNAIEDFFHDQNNIEFSKFVRKIYDLMESCPAELHPRNYMKGFVPLSKDNYQKFENYPKRLVDVKNDELEVLRIENNMLESKIEQMERMEKSLHSQLEMNVMQEEQAKRMTEVERQYEEALAHEEERISHQRKLLLLYQKEIKERECKLYSEARNLAMKNSIKSKESELDNLLNNLERNKVREENDIMMAEENMNIREIEQHLQELKLKSKPGGVGGGTGDAGESLLEKHRHSIHQLQMQNSKLKRELTKVQGIKQLEKKEKKISLSDKINAVEDLLRSVHTEFQEVSKCATTTTTATTTTIDGKRKENKIKELGRRAELLSFEVEKLRNKFGSGI